MALFTTLSTPPHTPSVEGVEVLMQHICIAPHLRYLVIKPQQRVFQTLHGRHDDLLHAHPLLDGARLHEPRLELDGAGSQYVGPVDRHDEILVLEVHVATVIKFGHSVFAPLDKLSLAHSGCKFV